MTVKPEPTTSHEPTTNRWYVVQDGQVIYSCAERNYQKAENFSIDHGVNAYIVLAQDHDQAIRKAKQHMQPAKPFSGHLTGDNQP